MTMAARRYHILKPVLLSFLTPQGQHEVILKPWDGFDLECDGTTLWTVGSSGERRESNTTADVIGFWLRSGAVVAATEPSAGA